MARRQYVFISLDGEAFVEIANFEPRRYSELLESTIATPNIENEYCTQTSTKRSHAYAQVVNNEFVFFFEFCVYDLEISVHTRVFSVLFSCSLDAFVSRTLEDVPPCHELHRRFCMITLAWFPRDLACDCGKRALETTTCQHAAFLCCGGDILAYVVKSSSTHSHPVNHIAFEVEIYFTKHSQIFQGRLSLIFAEAPEYIAYLPQGSRTRKLRNFLTKSKNHS